MSIPYTEPSAATIMSNDKTWSGWLSKKYNDNYNSYVPWLEDKYLNWYGENKTSYTAKGKLSPLSNPKFLPLPIAFARYPLPLLPLRLRPPLPALLCNLHFLSSFLPLEQLKENPLTDDKNVAAIQGGVAEGVGGQLSSGGLLGGIGDMSSKEGMNRVERGELDPSRLEEIKKKEQTR